MNIQNKPKWIDVAKQVMPDPKLMDAEGEYQASEIIQQVKEHELATNPQAKNWEEGRKREWQANKKYWKKERASKVPNPGREIVDSILNGGKHNSFIYPCPGYLVVQEIPLEETTESGLILSQPKQDAPNTAHVVAVGDELVVSANLVQRVPCKAGDKILFRKYAGMKIELRGEDYLFLTFTDVIGCFEKEDEDG